MAERRAALSMRVIAALPAIAAAAAAIAVPAFGQVDAVRIASRAGLCFDVQRASTGNGAGVILWECNGQANQSWRLVLRDTDEFGQAWFEIRAVHSNRCLDVQHASTAIEAKLIQYDCTGNKNQSFSVSPDSPEGRVIRARHSGLCLDIFRQHDRPGTQLQQYTCTGGSNQRFSLRGDAPTQPAPTPTPTLTPTPNASPPPGPAEGETRVLFYRVTNLWELRSPATLVRRLRVRGLPGGTVVTVRCRGGGCPFANRRHRARRGQVNLQRPFRGRRLAPGATLRLVLDMPGFGRYQVRFRARAGALPRRTDYCPSRRSAKLRRCG
jgi:hypothetical protein